MDTLLKVTHDRTCIIATSRIAEISHADVILTLSHGRLIEKGTHAELLAQKGCYAMLLQKQENTRKAAKVHMAQSQGREGGGQTLAIPAIKTLKFVTGEFARSRHNSTFGQRKGTLNSVQRLSMGVLRV